MLNFIRWLLVLPAAIGGWCTALLVTILSHSALESLCPVDPAYPAGPRLCGDWLPLAGALVIGLVTTLVMQSLGQTSFMRKSCYGELRLPR